MADVRPFTALRYNPDRVPLDKVVTQPYDKISDEMRNRYYAADPHNIVRVILGKTQPEDTSSSNVYTRAAATLQAWRAAGVIESMHAPAFFVCRQRFAVPGTGEPRVRKGFIGLGRLEDYANGVVYPHERTLAGPKQDRLELLRKTRTHFEQIFMLYEDVGERVDRLLDTATQRKPDAEVIDEYGVVHTLWAVTEQTTLSQIQEEMKGKKLIIADGHHRYETALAYRDEIHAAGASRNGAHEWLPMTFFNMSSPALTVLPTHRVVRNLRSFDSAAFFEGAARFFDMEEAATEPASFAASLAAAGRKRVTIGVTADGGSRQLLLGLKDIDLSKVMPDLSETQRSLDVAILQRLLFEQCMGLTEQAIRHESHLVYVREFDKAMSLVSSREAQLAFLLNPVSLEQLKKIVYEGNIMPQKSTDFYPKILSGLVLFPLVDSPDPSA